MPHFVPTKASVEPRLAGHRTFAIAILVLATIGVVVRLLGVSSMSLWLDEAVIANIVSRGRYEAYLRYPASNRPFGYLVASGWLASVYNSELTLRLLSLIPSLLTLPLAFAISRRLFRHRLFVLLLMFSVALNAGLVTFAKEFKPYAAEQFIVMLWLYLFLRWRESGRPLFLATLCGTIAVAPLFAHAPMLAAPTYAAAVAGLSLRRGSRCGIVAAGTCLVIALALALVQYHWSGSNTPPELFVTGSASYFTSSGTSGVLRWWGERGVALLGDFVPIGREPASGLLLAVCVLGVATALVRFVVWQEWTLAWLLASPIFATMVLSIVFPWPFGPERVNLHLVTLLVVAVLLGWEFALERTAAMRALFALAFVALQLPVDSDTYTQKFARFGAAQEELVPAITSIAHSEASAGLRGCVIFNRMSTYAVRYYSTFHTSLSRDVRAFLVTHPHEFVGSRSPDAVRDTIERAADSCDPLWVVLAHYDDEERIAARDALSNGGARAVHEEEFIGVVVLAGQR